MRLRGFNMKELMCPLCKQGELVLRKEALLDYQVYIVDGEIELGKFYKVSSIIKNKSYLECYECCQNSDGNQELRNIYNQLMSK